MGCSIHSVLYMKEERCFCFTMRFGSLLVGVLDFFLSIIGTLHFSSRAMSDNLATKESGEVDPEMSKLVRIVSIILTIIFVIHAVFAVLVLVGVILKKPKCLIMYVYQYVIIWWVMGIIFVGNIIFDAASSDPVNFGVHFIAVMIVGLTGCVTVLFAATVYTHYFRVWRPNVGDDDEQPEEAAPAFNEVVNQPVAAAPPLPEPGDNRYDPPPPYNPEFEKEYLRSRPIGIV